MIILDFGDVAHHSRVRQIEIWVPNWWEVVDVIGSSVELVLDGR